MSEDEIVNKLTVMCKLLYMQLRPEIEELKNELKLTQKQLRVYEQCDGENNMEDIAKKAKCSLRYVRGLLPEWEMKGLILGFGKGRGKKYVNIENLGV
jgi:DNA-binding MarR family transcriptional regulator